MGMAPERPVKPPQVKQAASPPPKAAPPAPPKAAPLAPPKAAPLGAPQAGPPLANLLSGQPSNKNLFIILGISGAVLFFCLTFALIYTLVGGRGGNTDASGTGPIFPEDKKGGDQQANPNLPRDPGPIARKPRQAAEGFLHALMNNSLEDAFNRTSRFYGQTPDQFRDSMELHRPFRRFTAWEMRATSPESGDLVTYRGNVSGPNGKADFEIEVVQEGNGYYVRAVRAPVLLTATTSRSPVRAAVAVEMGKSSPKWSAASHGDEKGL